MCNHHRVTDTDSVPGLIRNALSQARTSRHLKPVQLARRMAALGYPWHPQTVSNVESGRRRIPAEELLALALCLEVPLSHLLMPQTSCPDVVDIDPPTFQRTEDPGPGAADGLIPASVVAAWIGGPAWIGGTDNDPWLLWDGDEPLWPSQTDISDRLDLDRKVKAAEETREEANWVVALAAEKHAKVAGLDEESTEALAALAEVRRAGEAARNAVDDYMAALRNVQQHRTQVRARLLAEAQGSQKPERGESNE